MAGAGVGGRRARRAAATVESVSAADAGARVLSGPAELGLGVTAALGTVGGPLPDPRLSHALLQPIPAPADGPDRRPDAAAAAVAAAAGRARHDAVGALSAATGAHRSRDARRGLSLRRRRLHPHRDQHRRPGPARVARAVTAVDGRDRPPQRRHRSGRGRGRARVLDLGGGGDAAADRDPPRRAAGADAPVDPAVPAPERGSGRATGHRPVEDRSRAGHTDVGGAVPRRRGTGAPPDRRRATRTTSGASSPPTWSTKAS